MKQRVINILVSFDQFCASLVYLGKYSPDETISGIIGYKTSHGEANFIEKAICCFLKKIDSNHCKKSIDYEEWD